MGGRRGRDRTPRKTGARGGSNLGRNVGGITGADGSEAMNGAWICAQSQPDMRQSCAGAHGAECAACACDPGVSVPARPHIALAANAPCAASARLNSRHSFANSFLGKRARIGDGFKGLRTGQV